MKASKKFNLCRFTLSIPSFALGMIRNTASLWGSTSLEVTGNGKCAAHLCAATPLDLCAADDLSGKFDAIKAHLIDALEIGVESNGILWKS